MPPHADPLLEERILKAAQRLSRTRGEHGLTLRAVAREAGSTTPTVYKRFRNKQALLNTMAERFKAQLYEHLFAAKTLEEVCSRYLSFAEEHPHEYQLLWHSWTDIFHPRPAASGTRVAAHPIRKSFWRKARRLRPPVLRHISPRPRRRYSTQCPWR